jgi:hypothetical protein
MTFDTAVADARSGSTVMSKASGYGDQPRPEAGSRLSARHADPNIGTFKADGKAFVSDHELKLPIHTRQIEIGYAALSFLIPEKIQFLKNQVLFLFRGVSRGDISLLERTHSGP